jgi:serine/threonine protein kinase
MAKYRRGDVINGYILDEDFRMKDGANCEWTFATKGSERYFIKQFLAPRYPVDGAPGSPAERDRRRGECSIWERHQRGLIKEAKKVAGAGGALVVPVTLFREGPNYFKVAPRVDVESFSVAEIARLPFADRLSIMSAVTRAVYALHNVSIVHGDIAAGNVLISLCGVNMYKANVIDFDNSYVVGDPPPFDEIMGNPPYYSPELLDYVQGRLMDPAALTVRSDIFALGVLFWQYLYGSMPVFDTDFQYPCEAVRAGDRLIEPAVERRDIHDMVVSMIKVDPSDRPSLLKISNALGKQSAPPEPRRPPESAPPLPPGPKPSGVRPPKGYHPPAPYEGPSRVRTKMKREGAGE